MATQILSFLFFFAFLLSSTPPSSAQQQAPSVTLSSFNLSLSPWSPVQNQILVSPNSVFAAGFRLVPNSKTLYTFSVWYRTVPESLIVWSANGSSSVNGSASLVITTSGQLRLNDFSGRNLWPGDAKGNPNSTSLTLSNEGNLSFANWQSFKFPTDTILPTQNMTNTRLVSKNSKYSFPNSLKLVFNNTGSYWEATDGNAFLVLQNDGRMVQNNGKSFIPADFGSNNLRRLTLEDDGNLKIYSYDPDKEEWVVVWKAMTEMCRVYGTCGPNAICISDGSNSSTNCECPPGFAPLSGGATEGCAIKIPINDAANTKFLQLDYVNYTSGVVNNTNFTNARNLAACQDICYKDAKCQAFGFKYDGTGYCALHLERLLYGYWSPGTEAVMYLRVDKSETDKSNFGGMTKLLETTCPVNISLPLPPEESSTTARNIAIICTLFAAELLSGVFFFWRFLKKYIKYRDMAQTLGLEFLPAGGPKRFTYAELKAATKDFSNLIGKGGFGDVYKGELPDHRVVAVKCLKYVAGGDPEFWAEVTIIARMHHLNLVRLWGFCAEKGKRILVYEYVPNGSLDKYIFHPGRANSREDVELEMGPLSENGLKPILDWGVRYRIALGVARAIAYLHEECLEWVLHCDIKPENILLGDDFCPKISDFGLAKLKKKEDMVSMSRMRGTRGYMAPEWVRPDPITAKADVYSYGMVLLEIVTGTRNFEIQGSVKHSEDWYFPGWAFEKVYKEIKVEDILDRQIKHTYDSRAHFHLVDRMVKTAMWCLQDRPEKRPPMGKVAKMLEGTVEITEPGKPTIFFLGEE